MRLVYKTTNEPVCVGDEVKFDDETVVVDGIEKPRHGGSTGRVYVKNPGSEFSQGYFPGVFDMHWIERDDQWLSF